MFYMYRNLTEFLLRCFHSPIFFHSPITYYSFQIESAQLCSVMYLSFPEEMYTLNDCTVFQNSIQFRENHSFHELNMHKFSKSINIK